MNQKRTSGDFKAIVAAAIQVERFINAGLACGMSV